VNRTRSILVGACLLLMFASLGISDDQSWSLSKLNPFSKTTSTKPKTIERKPAPPSTWGKVSSGTKNSLTKTNETINPWAKKSSPTTSRTSSKQPANQPKAAEKKSFLSSMWPAKEEPKKPKTVSEFLAQPKPK
jgi:hypothetical protein